MSEYKAKDPEKLKRIGRNLKTLRTAYGETQEELGAVIDSEKNVISFYENGKREPDEATLTRLAKHFEVSVDSIRNFEIEYAGPVDATEVLLNSLEELLPIYSSEECMASVIFRLAYERHRLLYEGLKKGDFTVLRNLLECLELYESLYVEDWIGPEIFANSLAIFTLILFAMKFINDFDLYLPSVFAKMTIKETKKSHPEFVFSDEDLEKLKVAMAELTEDIRKNEEYDVALAVLKRYPKYSALADYYITLEYLYYLLPEGLDEETSKKIGMEIGRKFLILENPQLRKVWNFINDVQRPFHFHPAKASDSQE